ncbi:MAG TPA: tetratricopeptide repeat protein [Azospira sp.]|nr:tetratricopeptide repeat protein [Azospira sp.]
MSNQFLAQCIQTAHAANSQGSFPVAESHCKQALKLAPDLPEAWYNLGIALAGQGKRAAALNAFEKAHIHTLASPDAQNSIAVQLIELGAYREAEKCLTRALKSAPEYVFAYSNLAKIRECQRRLADAEALLRQAIALAPGFGTLYINLGGVLNAQKRHEEAEQACLKAVELDLQVPDAWSNLGSALLGLGRNDAAEQACRKAIDLGANTSAPWTNLGIALYRLKRYEETEAALARGLSLHPDAELLAGLLADIRMKICDWHSFASTLPHLFQAIERGLKVIYPFSVLGLTADPAIQRQAAEIWANLEHPAQSQLGPLPKRTQKGKIRIGYYSADFHNHATTYLMAELFERHNRETFEVIGFSFGPNKNDEMRQRVASAFDQFIDVTTRSDKEVAQLSRDLEIDIAIDLKGYTDNSRPGIFSYRAAPIQVNYLGYPGTMGAKYIDYIIADATLIPVESQRHYSEKIVYLPNSYQVNDAKRVISDRTFTRAELKLPSDAFVFCCFNDNYKINPPTLDLWASILNQVDNSVLWLFEQNPAASRNLRKEAALRGIAPERLIFAEHMPLPDHLARHRAADLFIDTLPYNAHTTASDALWAGLPVLTCPGKSFASRVAASLLKAIGLPELIVASLDEYQALAIELATQPVLLADIKCKLENNRLTTPLFDSSLFTEHLEAACVSMYENHQADRGPQHLYIAS